MYEFLCRLEDVSLSYELLASMSMAVEDAMQYGPNAADTYYGAQSLLSNLLYENAKILNGLMQEKFMEARPREPCNRLEEVV